MSDKSKSPNSKSDEKDEKSKSSEKGKDEGEEPKDLKGCFTAYCVFGDHESDGTTIRLKNVDKWLTQAKVLDKSYGITNADTAITFSKIAKNKKRLDYGGFEHFLETLAKDRKKDLEELKAKLVATGKPKVKGVTKPVMTGKVGANLRRLTDPNIYTGSHKERFDETGKGKGLAGREDLQENTGYVSGFKTDQKKSEDKKSDDKKKSEDKKSDDKKKSDDEEEDDKKKSSKD